MVRKLACGLAIVLLLSTGLPTQATEFDSKALGSSTFALGAEKGEDKLSLGNAIRTPDGKLSVIVHFEAPPLISQFQNEIKVRASSASRAGRAKINLNSSRAVAYREQLIAGQRAFETKVKAFAPNARFGSRILEFVNAVSVEISEQHISALASMPGVKRVYANEKNFIHMDASNPLINSPAIWAQIGTQLSEVPGEGIYVAVVDSGIVPENPLFDDTGYPTGASNPRDGVIADDYCALFDPTFCNDKLIVAREFNDNLGGSNIEGPPTADTPRGHSGHGTHVAGTAAGSRVPAADPGDGVTEDIRGVAYGAWIGMYKALWKTSTSASGNTFDLANALNSAAADGLAMGLPTVINNSWGGGAGSHPDGSFYTPIIDSITNVDGMVVVCSAGNSGSGAQTIGCPGCIETAFTVANTTHNRIHGLGFQVVGGPGPVGAIEGTSPVTVGAGVGPAPMVWAGDDGNVTGCNPGFTPGFFAGSIALISRGSCSFADKSANAAAAGAIAMVVYNSAPIGSPIIMGGLDAPPATIPSVMITAGAGAAAIPFAGSNAQILGTTNRYTDNTWEDILSSSSSRGPDGDHDVLKPDIGAPGSLILSGTSVGPDFNTPVFDFFGGTSMAAPHIAGASALMLQLNPGWSPEQVRTALTSTSVRSGLYKDGFGTPADPFDLGAGRVDLDRAWQAGATFDGPSMADGSCAASCSWTRSITNELGSQTTFNAAAVNTTPGIAITINPTQVTLNPGESASFDVTADVMALPLDTWAFGGVTWTGGGAPEAFLPLAVLPVQSTAPGGQALSLNKYGLPSPVAGGDTVFWQIDLLNESVTSTISLTDVVPANSTFVPASNQAYINGVPVGGFNEAGGTLTWSNTLATSPGPMISAAPFAGYPEASYTSVSAMNPANFLLYYDLGPFCSSVCDESYFTLNLGIPITYLGVPYDQAFLSTNGYITLGDGTNAWDSANTPLPFPAAPNAVIAPFWTDFDLDGTDPGDTGNGTLYWAFHAAGYWVWEWQDAEYWNNPGINTSLQLWVNVDPPYDIHFVYGDITALPPVTVGAENLTGTLGDTWYFNGGGTAPAVGVDLELLAPAGDLAQFVFQTTAGPAPDPIVNAVDVTSAPFDAQALVVVDKVQGMLTATKAVDPGPYESGDTITYTIVLTNVGGSDLYDQAGDEFTDTLPPELTLTNVVATSGTTGMAANTATWNGGLAIGASVTITITATLNDIPESMAFINNQGYASYDSTGDGTNDTTIPTDDPATSPADDPTVILVARQFGVPVLGLPGVAILVLMLAGAAVLVLRRYV